MYDVVRTIVKIKNSPHHNNTIKHNTPATQSLIKMTCHLHNEDKWKWTKLLSCLFLLSIYLQLVTCTHHYPNEVPVPSSSTNNHISNGGYELISDTIIFKRWRSIISRVVRMPNGNIVDYDVSTLIKNDCYLFVYVIDFYLYCY